MTGASPTGIQLTATHNPMAFLFSFCKLRVTVDGTEQLLPWGTHFLPTTQGQHHLEMSFNYLGSGRGAAAADVPVVEGQITQVTYKMPSRMYAKGKMTVG